MTEDRLDNPVWHALSGPHARFAQHFGTVRRYVPDVAPFLGTADAVAAHSSDLLAALSSGGAAVVRTVPVSTGGGVEAAQSLEVLQMWAPAFRPYERPREFVTLADADVPAMLALVEMTKPGPFAARTIEMGRYLGVKDGGRLVAMAGERMRLDEFTEVSAVCVDPDYRGRGYAKALVSAVAEGIVASGATPFLHVFPANQSAIAAYEVLGFVPRRLLRITRLKRAES